MLEEEKATSSYRKERQQVRVILQEGKATGETTARKGNRSYYRKEGNRLHYRKKRQQVILQDGKANK